MTVSFARAGLALVIGLSACGQEAPRSSGTLRAPSVASTPAGLGGAALANTSARDEVEDVGQVERAPDDARLSEGEVVAAAVDAGPVAAEVSSPEPGVPAATTTNAAPMKVEEVPAGAAGEGERAPPSIVTPLPELCREACANAHRLVLAELPADTAKAMREEVQRALERECPGRCLQRASLDSARCIATAKSALELAACQ